MLTLNTAVWIVALSFGNGERAEAPSGGAAEARDIQRLDILKENYPRAFFFRATEQAYNPRRYPTYESWDRQFNRLQGIIGKCLDEECLGREPRNPAFFSRFKREHPTQCVLLHFNGNARDPRYHTAKYFPGHWIYHRATKITQDIPAESGETEIHVEDTRTFRINTGRYKTSNDDIALFGVTVDGKHDWSHCEQVQLIAVDARTNTITVRRGCYGTSPLAFPAGESRAAAHVVEGPWGRGNHLMWYYNFATHCPKDGNGNTCADLLVEDLAEWFGAGGKLAALDGLEFDVMHHQTRGDTDGDGEEDHGIINGVNQYGIGMVQFARQLRHRMTDNFIIQGDGALGPGGRRSQRAWGILNGIESEGWPNLSEWEFKDWSGGLNRHFFWRENARPPVFNYVNHKWNQAVPGRPGVRVHPQVPFARHRLVFAACQFFDAMICYSFAPRNDPDGRFGVWDELRCGVENHAGWLGRPEGPAVRLAEQRPDLLKGQGTHASLMARVSGAVATRDTEQGVVVSNQDPNAADLRFTIGEIPTQGADLLLSLDVLGDPRAKYPREMARFTEVSVTNAAKSMTWVNDRAFTSSFYFRDVRSKTVDLTITVEGTENVTVRSVTAHAHPDVICRVFEKGIVLANPSPRTYTFDLDTLSPGRSYRRIQGVATQDTQVNNGRPVGATVTLGERDALFLVRTD